MENIKKLISKDKLIQAAEALRKNALSKEVEKEASGLLGRLQSLKNQKIQGIISFDEENRERNQIRLALLSIANGERNSYPTNRQNISLRIPITIIIVIAGLILIAFLFFYNSSQTIGINGNDNSNNEIIISAPD